MQTKASATVYYPIIFSKLQNKFKLFGLKIIQQENSQSDLEFLWI